MQLTDARLPVEVEANVPARMRDGVILRADVYRPRADGHFPVLLQRTPYDKLRANYVQLAHELASRGYIVAIQDLRGRCASDGDFDPTLSPTHGAVEGVDGHDSAVWAAGLPGSTGRLGTWGVSYGSWTQWRLAPSRPPGLAAMFAGGMGIDAREVWPGIFTRDRQLQWSIVTIAPDTRRRLGLPGPTTVAEAQRQWELLDRDKWLWIEPLAAMPASALGGLARYWEYWISHQHVDKWQLAGIHGEVDVPVYHVTSWYDRMVAGTIEHFQRMVRDGRTERARRSQKLIVGPWTHGFSFTSKVGVMDFGADAALDTADLMARWFDTWLKDRDTGLMDEPPVRYFVMGENRWHAAKTWPPAGARPTTFYCRGEGAANGSRGDGALSREAPADEPPDRFVYDPRDPLMSLNLPDGQAGPADARLLDHRLDLLAYQTPPLDEDVVVAGPIELVLYAATSAPDTDWTARLIHLYADGFAVNLTQGIVRARYRDAWDRPSLLEPDRVYEYRIQLLPTATRFRAGDRIRLDISSSDFPSYDRNHNTGGKDWEDATLVPARQTVFHDARYPTRIVLPVVS